MRKPDRQRSSQGRREVFLPGKICCGSIVHCNADSQRVEKIALYLP
jgi:hypothetical protein